MTTLRADGIEKALEGITTLEEVLAVTQAEIGEEPRDPQEAGVDLESKEA